LVRGPAANARPIERDVLAAMADQLGLTVKEVLAVARETTATGAA
jgi:hypothetical protein